MSWHLLSLYPIGGISGELSTAICPLRCSVDTDWSLFLHYANNLLNFFAKEKPKQVRYPVDRISIAR
jgi:hypothetical protein